MKTVLGLRLGSLAAVVWFAACIGDSEQGKSETTGVQLNALDEEVALDEVLTGACVNEADVAAHATVDMTIAAANCAATCAFGSGIATCRRCVRDETGLGDECGNCYAAGIMCGVANCLGVCLSDVTSVGCVLCQAEHCLADFKQCSGITPGACLNDTDKNTHETVDVPVEVADCVMTCATTPDIESCQVCIGEATGLSKGCGECYAERVECGVENCISVCIADITAPACTQCQREHCVPYWEICTGLTSGV